MVVKKIIVAVLGLILFLVALELLIGGIRDNNANSRNVFGLFIMIMQFVVIIKIPTDRLENLRSFFTYKVPQWIFIFGFFLFMICILQILAGLYMDFVMSDILLLSGIAGMIIMGSALGLEYLIILYKFKKDSYK